MKGSKQSSLAHFLARFGSFSIGVVYVLVGVMALLSLLQLKDGGADEDSIMEFFKSFPLGEAVIVVILLGMAGYICWLVYEALTDPYEYGTSLKGLAIRLGIGLGAVAYGLIAYSALEALLGWSIAGTGVGEQRQLVAQIFNWSGGNLLVGIAGGIVAFAGLVQVKYVVRREYEERLNVEKLSPVQYKTIAVLAWAGHLARCTILLIVAYFLIAAAVEDNASAMVNTDKAFNFLGESTLGHPSFVLVALGTISYGFFMFALGLYYNFDEEDG